MPLPRVLQRCPACLPLAALALTLVCATWQLEARTVVLAPKSEQVEGTQDKPVLPPEEKSRIEAAFAQADRVMLCSQLPWEGKTAPDRLDTPLVEIRGAEKLGELVKGLDLAAGSFEQPCGCIGSHRLVFLKGDQYLFELTYHHLSRLRGEYGVPYWGDIQLSEAGAKALIQWFKANGFAGLEESRRKEDADAAKRAADHARLAAQLPEKARGWLPAYDHNSSDWKWKKDERVAALLGCFGDEREGVRTLWQMLGMNSRAPHGASRVFQGEPACFLIHALNHATPASLQAAGESLAVDDGDARLGAFLHAYHCHQDREWEGAEFVMGRILNRTMKEALDAMDEDSRYWIVRRLASDKTRPVPFLLAPELERALVQRARQPAAPGGVEDDAVHGTHPLFKLLALALELRDPALLPMLDKATALQTLSVNERKVCGVLSKLASGAHDIGPDDLLLQDVGYVELSLLCWRAYRAGNPGEPSLRMLSAALTSPSLKVRDEARKLLREAGIELDGSTAGHLERDLGRRSEEWSEKDRGRLQEAAKAAKTDKARKAAFEELGTFLLGRGEYEQALIAFRKGGAYASAGATLAGVALGRPDEGSHLSHILTGSAEQADTFMATGTAKCVVGRYREAAKAFEVASSLADWREAGNMAVAARLIRRLAEEAPVASDKPENAAASTGVEEDEEESATDAFVRGAITKEEFVRRRGKVRRPSDGAFTWWVVAHMARLGKDKAGELEALRTGTALGAHASVWHVLMVNRARELDLR